jgi:hypothetical protein
MEQQKYGLKYIGKMSLIVSSKSRVAHWANRLIIGIMEGRARKD